MSTDLNETTNKNTEEFIKNTEEFIGSTGNIIYVWWCPRCQADHYSPHCPRDLICGADAENYQRNGYEICPHCGQLIKKEVEGC